MIRGSTTSVRIAGSIAMTKGRIPSSDQHGAAGGSSPESLAGPSGRSPSGRERRMPWRSRAADSFDKRGGQARRRRSGRVLMVVGVAIGDTSFDVGDDFLVARAAYAAVLRLEVRIRKRLW